MSIEQNRPFLFERLASGVANKHVLDGGAMQPKQIFQNLKFDFCNKQIHVDLPLIFLDVEEWETIDTNDDVSKIRIHRDCMLIC